MNDRLKLFWVVIPLILVMMLFNTQHPNLASSDLWERQRVSAEILENGKFPSEFEIYEKPQQYLYPPLFDVLMAALIGITALSYVQAIGLMGILILIPFLLLMYFITKEFFGEKVAALAPFAALMIPRIFRISFQPLPEFLGITMLLGILYLVMKKKFWLAGIVFAVLPLVHFRTSVNAFLIIGLYLLWANHKQIKSLLLSIVPKVMIFPLITLVTYYILLPEGIQLQAVENPFVVSWSLLATIGPLMLISAFALYHIPFRQKPFLVSVFGIYLVIFLGSLVAGNPLFAFRESIFLFLPVTVLGAYGLQVSKEKFGVVPFVILIGLVATSAFYINSGISDPINTAEQNAIIFASSHTNQPTLMAGFVTNYAVPVLTDKKIVAGTFLEGVSDAEERIEKLHKFMDTSSPRDAVQLMHKYNADTVILGRYELQQWYPIPVDTKKFDSELFNKIYANGYSQVFQLSG